MAPRACSPRRCSSRPSRGRGLSALLEAIDARLAENNRTLTIEVPAEAGALMHWLHGNTEVLDRQTNDAGATVYRIRIGEALARPARRADEAGRARAAADLSHPARIARGPWPRPTAHPFPPDWIAPGDEPRWPS